MSAGATLVVFDANRRLAFRNLVPILTITQKHVETRWLGEPIANRHTTIDAILIWRERIRKYGEILKLGRNRIGIDDGQVFVRARAFPACVFGFDDDGVFAVRQNAIIDRAAEQLARLSDFDARLQPAVEALAGARAQLDDATRTLNRYLDSADLDQARLAEVEARVAELHAAARKYRCTPEELISKIDAAFAFLQTYFGSTLFRHHSYGSQLLARA